MTTSAQRWVAGLGLSAVLVVAACGASDTPTSVATGGQSHAAAPALVRHQAPVTTTIPAPTTSVAPAPTTTAPAPTSTTTRRAPTTTAPRRAPATTATTTRPPAPTTPTTAPAPPTTAAPVVSGNLPASTQSQMLGLVNAKRASGTTCGGVAYAPVPALSLSGALTRAADGHALDMATNNYFSHDTLAGLDPAARILAAGFHILYWAENIAAGQPTPAGVVATWFNSAGHCVNFMSGDVTQVGFGEAENPSSTYGIYWVADLGRPA